jgi:Right handed beta helix region
MGFVTYDGLVVRNGNYSCIDMNESNSADSLFGITVQNCEVGPAVCSTTENNPGGIILGNSTNAQILNCKIHDCTNTSGDAFGNGGITAFSAINLTITNCTIFNCGYSIQNKDAFQFGTYSYNYLDNGVFGSGSQAGQGAMAVFACIPGTGQTLVCHHNIMIGSGWRGIGEPGTGSSGHQVLGAANFHHNTFFCSTQNNNVAMVVQTATTATGPYNFHDNIVYYPGGYQTSYNGTWGGSLAFNSGGGVAPPFGMTGSDINFNYYGTGMAWGFSNSVYTTLAAWSTAQGFDINSTQGGSPFSGTPAAVNISSFAITGPATTAGSTGGPVGALDGTGSVGCNF